MNVLFHYDAGKGFKADLEQLAKQHIYVEPVSVANQEHFQASMQTCDVLWHVLEPVTREHISHAPKLKLIQKIGVGVNTIDLAAAEEHNIAVCNMPGTNAQAVAEMTLLLMLSALRRAPYFDSITRRGAGWDFPADTQDNLSEVSGKQIGFLGFGSVPQRLAPILHAMGASVAYHATAEKSVANATYLSLDNLLQSSDVLSIHVPLTKSTQNLIDTTAITKMKRGAVLINTARGGIVDEQALLHALQAEHLSAAGLDVFSQEPVDTSNELLKLNNVSVMPHLAWLTRETLQRSIAVAVENCKRLANGQDLLYRVASA